jgi:hypothetical protein
MIGVFEPARANMSFDKAEAPSLDLDEFSSLDRATWEEIDPIASRLFSASTDKFDIILLPKNSRGIEAKFITFAC